GAKANNSFASTLIGWRAGSEGSANVTGTDGNGGASSLEMGYTLVGDKGEGELNITDGAEAVSFGAFIAGRAGSKGTVTVDGAGSSWTVSGALFVGGKDGFATQEDELEGTFGDYGTASLTVSDGAVVTVGTLVASRSDLKGNG